MDKAGCKVEYKGDSFREDVKFPVMLESLLAIAPASLTKVIVSGCHQTFKQFYQTFKEIELHFPTWMLSLTPNWAGGWYIEQKCTLCGGVSNWGFMKNSNALGLSCGGCGEILAPQGVGIQMTLNSIENFTFYPASLGLLQRSCADPFRAMLEVSCLDVFTMNLLQILDRPAYWAEDNRWHEFLGTKN